MPLSLQVESFAGREVEVRRVGAGLFMGVPDSPGFSRPLGEQGVAVAVSRQSPKIPMGVEINY